jgi:hypothetical protein
VGKLTSILKQLFGRQFVKEGQHVWPPIGAEGGVTFNKKPEADFQQLRKNPHFLALLSR